MAKLRRNSITMHEEALRLTFCGIVIATFFAALSAGTDLKAVLSPSGTSAAITVLGLGAAFAFAYVVSAASAVKYQSPRQVDRFPLSEKVSHFFYDASINVFGIYALVLVVEWVTRQLHLPRTLVLIPLYLAIFSLTYFIARLVWAGAQRIIEWQYDYMRRTDEADKQRASGGRP